MNKRTVLFLLLAGCLENSTPMASQPANIGKLAYQAPEAWTHVDRAEHGRDRVEWTPADNARKESISVIRSDVSPALITGDVMALQALLMKSQQELPQAQIGHPQRFVTADGLQAMKVRVDFVPPDQTKRYTRVHVIVIGKDALVHVLYTAFEPDSEFKALDLVTNSIHQGEV